MMNIRRGSLKDLAQVQRLNRALFQFEHDQGFYHGDSYNLNWPYEDAGIQYFRSCLEPVSPSAVFVAENAGRLVGYIASSYATRGYRSINPIGSLDNMFVEDEYRGQGVGSALVAAFKQWAAEEGVAIIQVNACAGNKRAIKFYQRCGFADHEVILEQPLGHSYQPTASAS